MKTPVFILCLLLAGPLAAQENGNGTELVTDFEEARRNKIYHASRATGPVVIDGVLNDAAWEAATLDEDFWQSEPRVGVRPASKTGFRLMYDDDFIYVAVVCYQKSPIVINELGRDWAPPNDTDQVALLFDTFDDDRNGFFFQVNPGGGLRDQQMSAGVRNENWDAVYRAATQIEEFGWTAEFEIPFKSVRFDDTRAEQRWGFNIMRIVRGINETVMWTPIPRPFRITDVFKAGSLEGINGIRQGRNLRIKPFAVANFRPDVRSDVLKKNDFDGGLDLKYGITSSLTLDATVNTDFSQVEVDEQQVNLTRFSLFFPERRDFFLENSGLFDVGARTDMIGGAGPQNNRGGGGGGNREVIPFFSRRIGLSADNQPLPVRGGARLTGRMRGLDIALLNVQVGSQGNRPSDNWSVVRVRREILANSEIGSYFFNRQSEQPNNWNRSGGLDAKFRFFGNKLMMSGFGMKTYKPELSTENFAGTADVSYQDTLYAVRGAYLTIENDFSNDFGFVQRGAIRKSNFFGGVRPRPRRSIVREIYPQLESSYVTDQSNMLLTRSHRAGVNIQFHSGDQLQINRNLNFERLDAEFQVRRDTRIPIGDYAFNDWQVTYNGSRGRRLYGNAGWKQGGFWNGTLLEAKLGGGFRHGAHLNSELTWTRNRVTLPERNFTTDLILYRLNTAFNPQLFLESFVQYNTDSRTVSTNVRFRFIHHPLSDLFVVYNDVRGIRGNLEVGRALSIKLTHLFSF